MGVPWLKVVLDLIETSVKKRSGQKSSFTSVGHEYDDETLEDLCPRSIQPGPEIFDIQQFTHN